MTGIEDFANELLKMKKEIAELKSQTLIKYLILPSTGVLRPPVVTADPASPTDGDIWYRSDTDVWKGRKNGTTVTFTTS